MFNTFYLKNKNSTNKNIDQSKRLNTTRVVLFTNARNEKYILEWIAHHLGLGFDNIIIFDHKSIVPISSLIKKQNKVFVKRIEMDGAIKLTLMKMAVKIARSLNADWMLYLDADEFLHLRFYKNVKHLLNNYYFADSLAINWLMFGSNNLIKDPTSLMIEAYTKSEPLLDQHVKTFVRPQVVKQVTNPHFYVIYDTRKMFGLPFKLLSPPYSFNKTNLPYEQIGAYIAHYVYQSEESYKRRKTMLPADDTGTFRNIDENIHIHYNKVNNNELKKKYVNKILYIINQIKNF